LELVYFNFIFLKKITLIYKGKTHFGNYIFDSKFLKEKKQEIIKIMVKQISNSLELNYFFYNADSEIKEFYERFYDKQFIERCIIQEKSENDEIKLKLLHDKIENFLEKIISFLNCNDFQKVSCTFLFEELETMEKKIDEIIDKTKKMIFIFVDEIEESKVDSFRKIWKKIISKYVNIVDKDAPLVFFFFAGRYPFSLFGSGLYSSPTAVKLIFLNPFSKIDTESLIKKYFQNQNQKEKIEIFFNKKPENSSSTVLSLLSGLSHDLSNGVARITIKFIMFLEYLFAYDNFVILFSKYSEWEKFYNEITKEENINIIAECFDEKKRIGLMNPYMLSLIEYESIFGEKIPPKIEIYEPQNNNYQENWKNLDFEEVIEHTPFYFQKIEEKYNIVKVLVPENWIYSSNIYKVDEDVFNLKTSFSLSKIIPCVNHGKLKED
jgi:hypothetical protein